MKMDFIFRFILFVYMYTYTYVCMYTTCMLGTFRGQKKVSGTLELDYRVL